MMQTIIRTSSQGLMFVRSRFGFVLGLREILSEIKKKNVAFHRS